MSQFAKYFFPIICILGIVLIQNACMHDAIMGIDLDPDPIDSMMNPTDTMVTDTTVTDTTVLDTTGMSMPCDTNKVYFEQDILPIFNSSCALSGCHDVDTAEKGVVLSSYEKLIASDIVVPFDLAESKLFKVISEDDVDDVMPPSGRLDNELIVLISKWILQGADTLSCDNPNVPCGVETVTYSNTISSLLSTNCNGCHGTNVASGGVVTDNYNSIKTIAESGRLYGALAWQQGYVKMPLNLGQLDSCSLVNIKIWIDEGAHNN